MAQLFPLKKAPGSLQTLFRASLTGLKKPGDRLPEKGYTIKGLTIDKKQYSDFCKMFEYNDATVPSTYWYIRLFSMQTLLLAHPDAPFPMPGLVHLSFKINQYTTIYPTDKLDTTVKFGNLIQHDKGTGVETIMSLSRHGQVVWEQKNINLYLGKKGLGIPGEDIVEGEITEPDLSTLWSLHPKNAIDFAKVSGDFNPIHLHDITAKIFGFRKQIAHGWYSLCRAVSPMSTTIKGIHELYGSFKKPLFLPSKVLGRTQEDNGLVLFDVINEKEGYPHLKGYVKKG
ncbi:MAG TPA: MaoC/PaaZ C-terminal domain-containing protein [Chitinophagales bacterium]|nr:MaoC/PaaZ C-terminal domain-containing protein [Chitinophagales bacterium]